DSDSDSDVNLLVDITIVADVDGDNVITGSELNGSADLEVHIGLGADAYEGMEVELNVDGELSTHIVTADDIANGYIATTITTTGSGVINIEATATNNDGVTDTSSLVITIAPQDLITEIEVIGDVDGNGFITADELDIDGNFTVHVGLGDGAYEGLVVSVNGSDYVVTQADLDNGYIVATIAGVDGLVNITAEASDVWGDTDSANISIT
ncbi:hypothetical protein, partial [Acinetobacter haemolyticus]